MGTWKVFPTTLKLWMRLQHMEHSYALRNGIIRHRVNSNHISVDAFDLVGGPRAVFKEMGHLYMKLVDIQ